MISHIGSFIANTVKPLVEELDKLLGKCSNLHLTKEELNKTIENFIEFELEKTYVYCILSLILGVLFCLTVYFILR